MRVMIVGASSNREKFGNKSVRAHVRAGHEVLPVNPRADEIEGLRCYRSIGEVPGPIDRASLYLPPKLGMEAVRELAARGDVAEVWLNPGAGSPELVAEARRLGFEPVQACSIIAIGERPE
jgi:predicted CoA-binding protein